MSNVNREDILKALKKYHIESERVFAEWRDRGYSYPPPVRPVFPEECRGMTCGAKTRKGTPCKRKCIYLNGRCKLHGGLSTGPRTQTGKRRSALNGLKPKKKQSP